MTSPVPTGPATTPGQILDGPAETAHGWLTKLELFVAEAKKDLSRFVPASSVDAIEAQAVQDARNGIQITEHGEADGRISSPRVIDVDDPNHPATTTGAGLAPLPGDNDRAARQAAHPAGSAADPAAVTEADEDDTDEDEEHITK